jgi:hypothetical protein
MAVSSVGLRLKCDCSGKAQKQLYSKLQSRFLVREDALIAKQHNCQTKEEEQDKIWSRIPKGGPIPRLTGRLTVGRKKNSNSNSCSKKHHQFSSSLHVRDQVSRPYKIQQTILYFCIFSSLTLQRAQTFLN